MHTTRFHKMRSQRQFTRQEHHRPRPTPIPERSLKFTKELSSRHAIKRYDATQRRLRNSIKIETLLGAMLDDLAM